MPIYEYSCPACRSESELLVRNSEQPSCPDCGSQTLDKLLSVPAAPVHASENLPVCNPMPGPCGRGGCGMGGCQLDG